MTRDKFITDLPSIICSSSASNELKIEMITKMLDKYTEELFNKQNELIENYQVTDWDAFETDCLLLSSDLKDRYKIFKKLKK